MSNVVYLASWPRSGNTLLRAILWQCFGLESCSTNSEASMYARNSDWHKLTGAVPFPNRMKDIQEIIDRQGVCFFKTHAAPEDLADTPEDRQVDDETRTIYLIRDGREACVSYWHYYRDILEDQTMTLERIIRGDCLFGSWSEHVRAWGPSKPPIGLAEGSNIMRLHYEDICAGMNARDTLSAKWYTPGKSTVGIPALIVAGFIEHHPSQFGDRASPLIDDWEGFHRSDPQFFRSGTNDTWKTEMTGDDLALFDELHGDTMREYGYYPAKESVYA